MERKWWQNSIVYQIYPKSFYDSNGDGIGDIRGIIDKLDYIHELGADVIWLCPVYKSPMMDNGYDISDYMEINEMFGSMEDMDELIEKAAGVGIKIIMDLVVNHTSDEHPWFVASRSDKHNPYRDFYYWRAPSEDGSAPNNWKSVFGGSAWEYDAATKEYYLHVFGKKQPDLNWENPKVRKQVAEMVNWWLDKGIAGFRVDAITYIKKKEDFSSIVPMEGEQLASISEASLNQPGIHEFLKELDENCFSRFDIMTVAEAPGVFGEEIGKYIGDGGHFSMIFDFSHIDMDIGEDGLWCNEVKWTVADLKKAVSQSQSITGQSGWGSLYLENHDQPRSLNKFIKEQEISEKSAKMLAGFYFLLRGTPFIYQGQEIGMTNVKYESIDEYDDIASIDQYHAALSKGFSEEDALAVLHRRSRDNSRTPMQWNSNENAGFTTGMPWLKVNQNFDRINVKSAVEQKDSIYHFYRELIRLRKNSAYSEVLTYGTYEPVFEKYSGVVAYLRIVNDKRVLAMANFKDERVEIRPDFPIGKCIISNCSQPTEMTEKLILEPYEFVAFEAQAESAEIED